jgi:predicted glycogen debranching enzyme
MPRPRAGAEWIEADGLGGFASGTVDGIRTRRYHALLLVAATPPSERFVLVNGLEAWIETAAGRYALTSHVFGGAADVVHPDGIERMSSFEAEPWPRWRFDLEDGTSVEQEVLVRHGVPVTLATWRLREAVAAAGPITLCVRPLLSGRDYHALHHVNADFRFDSEASGPRTTWRPYDGVPAVSALANGAYAHDPIWYRNFLYEEERARGLDYVEDLASPGTLRFDLTRGEAVLVLAAASAATDELLREDPVELAGYLRARERERRAAFPTRLHRSADAYLVRRGSGRTIIAGYPWFTDWGRDTFIALRGLCLATGRLDDARDILLEWAAAVSEGMLPNRFPDRGEQPEFNSVDASLWYVIAVHDWFLAARRGGARVAPSVRKRLQAAVKDILTGYADGTRFGIRADADGLLRCGEPGSQLTWMDARVGDRAVTPRIGKPVEVQALWLNALWFASSFGERWRRLYALGCDSFHAGFWNDTCGHLYDVVDVDHQPGRNDATFRPNQILAVGGLPVPLVDLPRAARIVEAVERRLWTPLGLRSLAPREPGYRGRYEGDSASRDSAYHQGTVWPWLTGAFIEGWLRVHGGDAAAKLEARRRFLAPLLAHLEEAGLGHVSEIADADAPHVPRGCPFQAWSLGELLRVDRIVLAPEPRPAPTRGGAALLRSSVAMLAAG